MKIKKYALATILGLLVFATNTFAEINEDLPQKMILAFKQGNSESLSDYFESGVELSIQNKEAIYSKQQAKQVLAKFFKDFPPTNFKTKHTGGKPDARYATAELQTEKGNFRVSFLLKKQGGSYIIHQLNIEKD